MEKLPFILEKNGMDYIQNWRNDNFAIYEQHFKGRRVGFELWKIIIQKESKKTIGGIEITFSEKEKIPNNESFGNTAWFFTKWKPMIDKMKEESIKNSAKDKNNG